MTQSMTSAAGAVGRTDDWTGFMRAQHAALAALVAGDPAPFQRLWDDAGPVSLLGAFGGVALGRREVCARLAAVARLYGDGLYEQLEYVVERVGETQAHTVHLEVIRSTSALGEEVVRRRRVTKVYRRGDRGWRIGHMHADPLVTTEFPGQEVPT
ncbi:MAG: DUF4440 domain-containing protein [Janibacter sp.]